MFGIIDFFTGGTGKTHLRGLYLEDCLIEAGRGLARQVGDRLDFISKNYTAVWYSKRAFKGGSRI